MSILAKTFRDEIQRLSRREIKQAASKLRRDHLALKKVVSAQKLRIAELEKLNRDLAKQQQKLIRQQLLSAESESDVETIPIYSKSIKGLRRRLALSQAALAELAGVSVNSVVLWEKKSGKINIRKPEVRRTILELKGLRKAEVSARLEQKKKTRRRRPRKRK
jgi:DNA-binding transcriptional regulator YiaG